MITQIGIVAGKILNLLEGSDSPVSLDEVEFCIDEPSEMIFMSLGWLAREGYIHLDHRSGEYFITEIKTKPSPAVRMRMLRHSINN